MFRVFLYLLLTFKLDNANNFRIRIYYSKYQKNALFSKFIIIVKLLRYYLSNITVKLKLAVWKTLLSTEIRFRHFVSSNPSLQPYINETTKLSSPILIPDCRRGQSYLFTSNPSPSPTPYLYTCTDIKWSDSGTACKWTAKFRRGKVFAGWNSHDKGGVVRVTSFASHGSKCRSTRFENTFPRWTLVSTLVRSVWIGGRGEGGEISSNRMERYWKKGKWKFGRAPLAEFIHFSSLLLLPSPRFVSAFPVALCNRKFVVFFPLRIFFFEFILTLVFLRFSVWCSVCSLLFERVLLLISFPGFFFSCVSTCWISGELVNWWWKNPSFLLLFFFIN